MKPTLNVNGKAAVLEFEDPGVRFLHALRDGLGLRGKRLECRVTQRGARAVALNGQALRSCTYPVGSAGNTGATAAGILRPAASSMIA